MTQNLCSLAVSKPKVLYITYDGLLEPLGQSQVLAYLESNTNHVAFTVLSFEKKNDLLNLELYKEVLARISRTRLKWVRLKYHKKFSVVATAFDILSGVLLCVYLLSSKKIQLVHARSYVAGIIALILYKITGVPYVFDIRGFWIDERVEGGLWKRNSAIYRLARWFESKLFLNACHIVTLTNKSISHLQNSVLTIADTDKISVVPTCTDVNRFFAKTCSTREIAIGNLGSLGTWYEVDPIFQFLKVANKSNGNARLVLINRGQHSLIRSKIVEHNIPEEIVRYFAAKQSEIPHHLKSVDIGLMLYKTGFSRLACSPTRFAEYLSAGIPCLVSQGVGDTQEIIEGEGVGVVISNYEVASLEKGFTELVNLLGQDDLKMRCRRVAKKYFSLEAGASRYNFIYSRLTGKQ
jgi:glycosyltransferase involved in cell wall biosynthesis